jgi:hypothetical protein|tara:strand:- start:600 stop:926 length:327 start_codon:yes stop_codon:yes gene_type:complete
MATEFEVETTEEFESMLQTKDIRISEALVNTILNNLKGKKRHIHALSVVCKEEDAIYDITVDRKDFSHTLETNLPTYEKEERYEECIEIKRALEYLKKRNKRNAYKRI